MMNFIKAKMAQHVTERELNRLSDRELTDLGINRSDIRTIARQTRYSEAF